VETDAVEDDEPVRRYVDRVRHPVTVSRP
jgi:hypothetical protein